MSIPNEASHDLLEASSPVQERWHRPFPEHERPSEGIALCLSGGGYRAMLFHLGALQRLNEFGYLPKVRQVSSVSGGSITAGVLGLHWDALDFAADGVAANFDAEVVSPIRRLAGVSIDIRAVLMGLLLPGGAAARLVAAYSQHLFGDATLQRLPDTPLIVINATNLQTGALWRFSKPLMADHRVGIVRNPAVSLATAVAASSAFPPFLSPVRLKVAAADYASMTDAEYTTTDLHRKPFATRVVLTDGGVYDNLGLETAWKNWDTILISDGGQKLQPSKRPWSIWPVQLLRVLGVIDNQVRSRRKDQALRSFQLRRALLAAGEPEQSAFFQLATRKGAYWHMADDLNAYQLPGILECDLAQTTKLARLGTRLAKLNDATQERLINWGYAACDAQMRLWVDRTLPPPNGFPYPGDG